MPAQSRTKRLARNAAYGVLSWLLPLLLTLIVTPRVVGGLGTELYGLYAIILSFISYSFAFGIGKIAAKYVAEHRAAGRTELLSQVVSTVFWLSLILALAANVVVILSARWITTDVLLIPDQLQQTATVAIYLAAATIAVTLISQVFQFVLQGLQLFDRYLWLTNLNAILLNLGSYVLVMMGYGVIALLAWNLAVVALVGVSFVISVRRAIPDLRIGLRVDKEHWSASMRYGLSIIAYQVLGNALLLFERGWIVRRFGTTAAAYYVVPMMLGFYFHAFISSIVLVLFPSMNELLQDRQKLITLYEIATKSVVALTAYFLVTTVVCGQEFLADWLGSEFAAASYQMLVFHAATFAVLAILVIPWHLTETFRAPVMNVFATMAWVGIAVPLIVILSSSMQTTGVALGRFIGVLAYLPLIWVAETRFLAPQLSGFWLKLAVKVSLTAAVVGAVEWLIVSIDGGWLCLACAGAAGFVLGALGLHILGLFTPTERASIGSVLARRIEV